MPQIQTTINNKSKKKKNDVDRRFKNKSTLTNYDSFKILDGSDLLPYSIPEYYSPKFRYQRKKKDGINIISKQKMLATHKSNEGRPFSVTRNYKRVILGKSSFNHEKQQLQAVVESELGTYRGLSPSKKQKKQRRAVSQLREAVQPLQQQQSVARRQSICKLSSEEIINKCMKT